MNDKFTISWLLFHFVQIIVFQFYASIRLSKLSYVLTTRRNPAVANDYMPEGGMLHSKKIDYVLGFICLCLLVVGFVLEDKYLYWAGKYISLFGFLFCMELDLLKYKKLKKLIPLVERRSASLVERKIGRIIPLWSWGIYLIVNGFIFYYDPEMRSKISYLITVAVVLSAAIFTEVRSKLPISTIDDELYRKSEAWTIFIIAWSFPIVEPFKKHLGFYGMDGIFSTIPLICFFIFLNSKIYKKIVNEQNLSIV